MIKNTSSKIMIILISCALGLCACSEGVMEKKPDPESLCQVKSGCVNENTWMSCDPETGKIDYMTCHCLMELNQCFVNTTSQCLKDLCLDDNTLMECDKTTGLYHEVKCACDPVHHRCTNTHGDQPLKPGEKCRNSICQDTETLLYCELSTGYYTERRCQCNIVKNICVGELPPPENPPAGNPPVEETKCTKSVCLNSRQLQKCDEQTGKSTLQTCAANEICTFGQCENKKFEDYTCQASDPQKCIGDTMYMMCDDITGDEEWTPVIHHCSEGRVCENGICVPKSDNIVCTRDVCKDVSTVLHCTNGKYSEEACSSDQICIQGACTSDQGLKRCSSPSECSQTQTCYMGFCYDSANLSLKVGDACNAMTFEEYCKDDLEYKCGYDDTVEVNDCLPYNGCSLYVKPAYRTQKPVINAICRGSTQELAECTQPGLPSDYCYSYVDTEFNGTFSFSFSVQDECIIGTDGRMIYAHMEIQKNCNGENMCELSTGFCK